MVPSKDTPTVADTLDHGDVDAGPQDYALRVLYSPTPSSRGQVRQLPRATTKLGRHPSEDGDFELADPIVSKLHAEITWSPVRERFLLGDLRRIVMTITTPMQPYTAVDAPAKTLSGQRQQQRCPPPYP